MGTANERAGIPPFYYTFLSCAPALFDHLLAHIFLKYFSASPAKNGDSSSRPSSPDKDRNGGGGASSPTVLATTERPKSRSSFVSMLFSSTGANKAADVTSPGKPSAGGGANINSSSSSPAKPGDGKKEVSY